VTRETRPFAEVLTWSVPEVRDDGMTLVMQWDTVAVPLHVVVSPSFGSSAAPAAAQRVVGRYRIEWTPLPPPPAGETRSEEESDWPTTNTFTVRYEGSELRAVMDPPMFRSEPGYTDWLLVPAKGDWYHPARFHKGELAEMMEYFAFRFDVEKGGVAKGFEVRGPDDGLLARGTRVEREE
jgi:hypothetical protein